MRDPVKSRLHSRIHSWETTCQPAPPGVNKGHLNQLMSKLKTFCTTLASLLVAAAIASAQDTNSTGKPASAPDSAQPAKAARQSQSESASKDAKFGTITKTDAPYTNALDAHALGEALKQTDKPGAFKGTVSGVYEPRGNAMAILNFDANYRSAMTALLRNENFSKFPELKTLVGKEVVVSGKLVQFQGRTEIVLTSPDQIKIVAGSDTKAEKKD
jgi:hypothetical protein